MSQLCLSRDTLLAILEDLNTNTDFNYEWIIAIRHSFMNINNELIDLLKSENKSEKAKDILDYKSYWGEHGKINSSEFKKQTIDIYNYINDLLKSKQDAAYLDKLNIIIQSYEILLKIVDKEISGN